MACHYKDCSVAMGTIHISQAEAASNFAVTFA
jgi:hypothetical protein